MSSNANSGDAVLSPPNPIAQPATDVLTVEDVDTGLVTARRSDTASGADLLPAGHNTRSRVAGSTRARQPTDSPHDMVIGDDQRALAAAKPIAKKQKTGDHIGPPKKSKGKQREADSSTRPAGKGPSPVQKIT